MALQTGVRAYRRSAHPPGPPATFGQPTAAAARSAPLFRLPTAAPLSAGAATSLRPHPVQQQAPAGFRVRDRIDTRSHMAGGLERASAGSLQLGQPRLLMSACFSSCTAACAGQQAQKLAGIRASSPRNTSSAATAASRKGPQLSQRLARQAASDKPVLPAGRQQGRSTPSLSDGHCR